MKLSLRNKLIHFFVLFFFIVTHAILLNGCKNEIPYEPAQKESLLIMNALLNVDSCENFVYLNLSGVNESYHVKEASVTIYINDKLAEVAEEYAVEIPVWDGEYQEPIRQNQKIFRVTSRFQPGDEIKLEAIAENGKYHVYALVKVPDRVKPIQVDTVSVKLKNYGSWNHYMQYKITFSDLSFEKSYYRLDVYNEISTQPLKNNEYVSIKRKYELINREDFILTDGHPKTDEEENDGFLVSNIDNKYNIFMNNRFRQSEATLKVYTPMYKFWDEPYLRRNTATIRIMTLTEPYYRYLRALNCIESEDYDETFMEPVIIPTNVVGGLGFVGVSSEQSVTLLLSETYVDYDDGFYIIGD